MMKLDPLEVPARSIPIPDTVSPELSALLAAPPGVRWKAPPASPEDWRKLVVDRAKGAIAEARACAEALAVRCEPIILDGVKAFEVVPKALAPRHARRLLLHIHGGCYVLNPGEAGLQEAILMAGFEGFRVISIDYRMPPDGYFPCAHDDVFAAYKAALKRCDASRLAVFGTSAGGALTLSLVQRAIAEKLPVPGAICSGTPMSDVVKRGDTFLTNETLDNVLVSRDGFCDTMTRLYANGLDLSDPRLSPIHGDFCGFPPTMLISGTRDLLLSNTVRVHRKLRQAGVEAALNVFEAMAHAQYLFDRRAPETREAFAEMATFFDRRLAF